jgi:hypothetical protein
VTVEIPKVELATSETRVFVTVTNSSKWKVNVSRKSMKVVQNGVRHNVTVSPAGYPQLATHIKAGTSSSGVIVFPALNPNGRLKLYLDVTSYNYDVGNFGTLPFVFTWP